MYCAQTNQLLVALDTWLKVHFLVCCPVYSLHPLARFVLCATRLLKAKFSRHLLTCIHITSITVAVCSKRGNSLNEFIWGNKMAFRLTVLNVAVLCGYSPSRSIFII